MEVLLASELVGMSVLTSDGELVGEVEDLEIDQGEWRVIKLVLRPSDKIAKEFGLKRVLRAPRPIKLDAELVSSLGDVVMLSVSSGELRSIIKKSLMGKGTQEGSPEVKQK